MTEEEFESLEPGVLLKAKRGFSLWGKETSIFDKSISKIKENDIIMLLEKPVIVRNKSTYKCYSIKCLHQNIIGYGTSFTDDFEIVSC